VEGLEDAATLVLIPAAYIRPQDRKWSRQSCETAENAAGKADRAIGELAAELESERLAVEIERDRKDQQQHADAQPEDAWIGMGDHHGSERHTGDTADQERPDQRKIEALPHRRKGQRL